MKNFLFMLCILILSINAFGDVVINEYVYDLPGTDVGEYIELYNTDSSPVDISGWYVLLVNGSTSIGDTYTTITIPAATTIPANDYYVIGNATVVDAAFGAGTVDYDLNLDNGLQNGYPDGIVLKDSSKIRLDSVAYEADASFGIPGNLETTNATAEGGTGRTACIAYGPNMCASGRLPDGWDTDSNLQNFANIIASPGAANTNSATLPYSDSFDSVQNPPWISAGWTALRVIDPLAVGKPGTASSNGGNVFEVFDSTGGGDVAFIAGAFDQLNFTGEIWIPADAATDMGWSTGVGIATRNECNWFSGYTGNSMENGFYLDYQNGALGGTLKGGAIPSHAGSAALLAVDSTTAINSGNVAAVTVTSLGTPATAVSKGAWNAFRLSFDSIGNNLYASINGAVIYDGVIPSGDTNVSGGVSVGFREAHGGAPVAGEGTWVDGIVLNTIVHTGVKDWFLY